MQLQISKAHIDILANPNGTDVDMMNKVANIMVRDNLHLEIVAGSDDPEEAYVTIAYDNGFDTIADMKESYKLAKKAAA